MSSDHTCTRRECKLPIGRSSQDLDQDLLVVNLKASNYLSNNNSFIHLNVFQICVFNYKIHFSEGNIPANFTKYFTVNSVTFSLQLFISLNFLARSF